MLQFITKLFSLDSGPCTACLVRMQDDMLLLHDLIIYMFMNTTLNHLDVGMLTMGTAIVNWLYFDYIC